MKVRKSVSVLYRPGYRFHSKSHSNGSHDGGDSAMSVKAQSSGLRCCALASACSCILGDDAGPNLILLFPYTLKDFEGICWHSCVPVAIISTKFGNQQNISSPVRQCGVSCVFRSSCSDDFWDAISCPCVCVEGAHRTLHIRLGLYSRLVAVDGFR